MISTVHSRTHQITGTSVQTNIFFVNMFLMNTFCYEIAIRSKHKATKFSKDGYITKSCRYQDFLELFADTFTDYRNVVWLFVRCIWNTDTTAQVDKCNIGTCFLFQFYCEFKQDAGKCRIVFVAYGVTGNESMNTKVFSTQFH